MRYNRIVAGLALASLLGAAAPALAADVMLAEPLSVHRNPVALVQRVEVLEVTPHARYVVYEDAPAYLVPVYGPHPAAVVRVPRYFPRGAHYNRPTGPLLKRCLC